MTSDPAEAADRGRPALAAIPSSHLRETLRGIAGAIPAGMPAVSVVKGIERRTFARPSADHRRRSWGDRPVAVLSGPSHAEEIARGLPASVVVAGEDEEFNRLVRDTLNTDRFRVYSNPDADRRRAGRGLEERRSGWRRGFATASDSAIMPRPALLTRGLAEMARFGRRPRGPDRRRSSGLAGVGDLITTCYSPFGRNRGLGERIGRGESLAEIEASTPKVAEGVPHLPERRRGRPDERGIAMPITEPCSARSSSRASRRWRPSPT